MYLYLGVFYAYISRLYPLVYSSTSELLCGMAWNEIKKETKGEGGDRL